MAVGQYSKEGCPSGQPLHLVIFERARTARIVGGRYCRRLRRLRRQYGNLRLAALLGLGHQIANMIPKILVGDGLRVGIGRREQEAHRPEHELDANASRRVRRAVHDVAIHDQARARNEGLADELDAVGSNGARKRLRRGGSVDNCSL